MAFTLDERRGIAEFSKDKALSDLYFNIIYNISECYVRNNRGILKVIYRPEKTVAQAIVVQVDREEVIKF